MSRPLRQALLIFLALSPTTLTLSLSVTLPPCTSPDLNTPFWTITDWFTDFTIPEEENVRFHLNNTLTGYTALCSRIGPYPEGYCVWVSGGRGEEDDTGTLFSYNERTGKFEIYQEWSCVENE